MSEQIQSNDEIIQSCIRLAQENSLVDVLWLYGSRAKGNANADSDYDLAVAFNYFPKNEWEKRLQPENLAIEWAEKLGLSSDQLSVVDINHIPLPLAFSITTTGKVLLVRDSLRLVREENRISSMWEIDYLYHRQHYG